MNPLIITLFSASILSVLSLLTVLLRASPLISPVLALPAFFVSVIVTLISSSTLVFYGIWRSISLHRYDQGMLLKISLREGIFFATASTIILLLHLLGILTWWVFGMAYVIVILYEVALHQ